MNVTLLLSWLQLKYGRIMYVHGHMPQVHDMRTPYAEWSPAQRA